MYKNILLVDHESNLATALQFLLGHAGFNVTLAGTYAEAEAAADRTRPDLALIDASLPDRSGYDLCQALVARPGLQHLPVLMLTTRSLQVEREKALSLGATDFVVKPFDPAAILGRVQELLREAA
ncbi:response regulator transcription factor [Spiribacter insolitus]|uniref:Response regulator transcription factor n=1 Tax=Spiribacter insolitus TaxID=3122417 RepID=A0ABV3T6F8_9GAMM